MAANLTRGEVLKNPQQRQLHLQQALQFSHVDFKNKIPKQNPLFLKTYKLAKRQLNIQNRIVVPFRNKLHLFLLKFIVNDIEFNCQNNQTEMLWYWYLSDVLYYGEGELTVVLSIMHMNLYLCNELSGCSAVSLVSTVLKCILTIHRTLKILDKQKENVITTYYYYICPGM